MDAEHPRLHPRLSNFADLAEGITDDFGIRYNTVEAYFQAAKSLDFEIREWISKMPPNEAKYAGRMVAIRSDWEDVKLDVMRRALHQKFFSDTFDSLFDLQILRSIAGEIIEWNDWHDVTWGRCICPKHNFEGRNLLGSLLMEIRDEKQT